MSSYPFDNDEDDFDFDGSTLYDADAEDVLRCDSCGKEFSVDVGEDPEECPHCGIDFC